MTFKFELGYPFRPFEQLMGVLPEASKELIPMPFRVCHVWPSQRYRSDLWLSGPHVRPQLANHRFLPDRIRARLEWKEARLGGYRENSLHRRATTAEGYAPYVSSTFFSELPLTCFSCSTRGPVDRGRKATEQLWYEYQVHIQSGGADGLPVVAAWLLSHASSLLLQDGTIRLTDP